MTTAPERGLVTFSSDFAGHEDAIADLFKRTFTASEGAEEGALIGSLADSLMRTTPANDLFVYLSRAENTLIGVIIFSRLTYSDDLRSVFVLGPVAVVPEAQGKGVGRALLRHGLEGLRTAGVDIALTYGNPAYYSKVGFLPISETEAAAPYPLQYPHGWLGQSLNGVPYLPIKGVCTCVTAFSDPAFW